MLPADPTNTNSVLPQADGHPGNILVMKGALCCAVLCCAVLCWAVFSSLLCLLCREACCSCQR